MQGTLKVQTLEQVTFGGANDFWNNVSSFQLAIDQSLYSRQKNKDFLRNELMSRRMQGTIKVVCRLGDAPHAMHHKSTAFLKQ